MESGNILKKYNILNQQFESSDKAIHVIKSHLMLKYKMLVKDQGSNVDTGPMCCKWCFNTWVPGKYRVILKPQKHPKKQMCSLLKKDVDTLNKYQNGLVSKIKKSNVENALILNCLICSKNTPTPLRKEKVELTVEKEESKTELQTHKRKKKKKDVFAGLNKQVVQNYKKIYQNEPNEKPKPAKKKFTKPIKEISFKQQLYIHRALLQSHVPKKKPSQLATFLDNM